MSEKNKMNTHHQPGLFNRKGLDLNGSDVSFNCQKVHLAILPHLLPPIFFPSYSKWKLTDYLDNMLRDRAVFGQEIHNRRGMLEVENITHVFSPKVMESWPETSPGLGRGICAEDKAKYLLFLIELSY